MGVRLLVSLFEQFDGSKVNAVFVGHRMVSTVGGGGVHFLCGGCILPL